MSRGPWALLGIDATTDKSAIRRAYADRLKAMDIDREVEAYAALRGARDSALAQAKRLDAQPDVRDPAVAEDGVRFEGGQIGASWDEQEALPRPDGEPQPALEPEPEPEPLEPLPPAVLYDLLFPQGEYCADGLSYEELQTGLAAIHVIADDAQGSAVDRERAIEEWLAHQLETAWPRSAYLVDAAASRFHWAETAGQLSELPAVRFLNPRLRGIRFVETVSQPGSPLHKAWVELSRVGPKNSLSRFRARPKDVKSLLAGIRENYPEVESYLDPVRVASWDRMQEAHGCAFGSGGIFAAIFAVTVLRAVISSFQADQQAAQTQQHDNFVAQNEVEGKRKTEDLVRDLFGDVTVKPKLSYLAPNLDKAVYSYRSMAAVNQSNLPEQEIEVRNLLRIMALRAAAVADFEDLVAIKRIQLDLMVQAHKQGGPDMCLRVIKGAFLDDDLTVSEQVRQQERTLYLRLLNGKLLGSTPVEFPKTAPIPGEVVKAVMDSTSLDLAGFEKAAKGEAPPAQQCAYQIALMETVLKQPAKVSIRLLRII